MLEGTKIKSAKRAVCADGDEDVGGAWEPGYVVDFAVVCDELGEGCGSVDVPDGAGGVY